MNFLLFLSLLFGCVNSAYALPPEHKGKFSAANLGFRYSSIYQKRGVIIYRDFQIDPVISLFFFDDRLAFLGESLDYQDFIYKDILRFRTRLVAVSDDPIFPSYDAVKVTNPNRPTTYEWSNGFDFYIPGYSDDYIAEFEFSHSKDLKAHSGNYLKLIGKLKLFEFTTLNTPVEPNLVAMLGWGDKAHNQFFYGPSDNESGLTDVSYGFWLAFPTRADRHYPIVQFMRFSVLGDHRNAEYAKDRNEGYLISFIASVSVLD